MNYLKAAAAPAKMGEMDQLSPFISSIPRQTYAFLFPCTQAASDGPVKFETVDRICRYLNQFKWKGISASPHCIRPLEDDILIFEGDTSTAMSLDFINRFLYLSQENEKQITEAIIERMRLRYQRSSFVFRARQAAFNTLNKFGEAECDLGRWKISLLLMFHNRKSTWSSKYIGIEEPDFNSVIRTTCEALHSGVHIIRMNKSPHTERESQVHSVVFIKESNGSYLYDPKVGCLKIAKGTESDFLHCMGRMYQALYGVGSIRFFKISETVSPKPLICASVRFKPSSSPYGPLIRQFLCTTNLDSVN